MKKILVLLLFSFSFNFGFSQDLIKNGNFESYAPTPGLNNTLTSTVGWDYVNGFPEYYHVNFNNEIGAIPHEGNGVVSIGLWVHSTSHSGLTQIDAIGTKLIEPMIAGNHYVLSFWAKNKWWDNTYCGGLQIYGLEETPAGISAFSPNGASLDPALFPNIQELASTPLISNSAKYKHYRICIAPETDISYLFFKGIAICSDFSIDDYFYLDDVSLFKEETFDLFGEDVTLCLSETIELDASFQNASISWNDGYSGFIRTITTPGTYSVTLNTSNPICPIKDTIIVDYNLIPIPTDFLQNDTTICYNSSFDLDVYAPDLFYQWSTGETTPAISISEAGNYRVTLSNGTCEETDNIHIEAFNCIDCGFFVPNAFSPNDDGINDQLIAFPQCEIIDFEMKIFNRWGDLIYQTLDNNQGWDGYWDNRKVSTGVYLYVISFSASEFGDIKRKTITGDVTVLR